MIALTTLASLALISDPPPETVQTLVQEVRRLRSAMTAGMRMQLTMHRISAQERALREAETMVAEAKSSVSELESRKIHFEDSIKNAEQGRRIHHHWPASNSEEERAAILEIRKALESLPTRLQEAKNELLSADSRRAIEKQKLDELNRQLDEIDRAFAADPSFKPRP